MPTDTDLQATLDKLIAAIIDLQKSIEKSGTRIEQAILKAARQVK